MKRSKKQEEKEAQYSIHLIESNETGTPVYMSLPLWETLCDSMSGARAIIAATNGVYPKTRFTIIDQLNKEECV